MAATFSIAADLKVPTRDEGNVAEYLDDTDVYVDHFEVRAFLWVYGVSAIVASNAVEASL